MAVESSTVFRSAREPIRTCLGCRRAVSATKLLRVVAGPRPAAGSGQSESVQADPRHRAAGRGAWIHPDPGCLSRASRRRAFGRALRIPEPVDLAAVEVHLQRAGGEASAPPPYGPVTSVAGSPGTK